MPYTSEQLSDHQDIIDLINGYCRAIDDNRPEAMVDLFTEDCELDYGGDYSSLQGRELAIRFFRGGTSKMYARSAHFASNIEISFDGPDRATGITYVNAWHEFTDSDRPNAWIYGRYLDEFARTTDGWRISLRRFRALGDELWGQPLNYIERN